MPKIVDLKGSSTNQQIMSNVTVKDESDDEFKIKKKKKKARWFDGCEYLCSICNKIFKQKPYLSNHLISMHQMTLDEYRIKHNVQEKIREYECKICNKLVLWNRDSIRKHIDRYHLLSIEFYEKTYLEKDSMMMNENLISPFKQLCPKKNKEKSEELFSQNINFDKTDGVPRCKKCLFEVKVGKDYNQLKQLKRHIVRYHFVCLEPFKCCDQEFWTKWHIFIHLVEHHRLEKNLFDKFSLGFNIEYLEKLILKETLDVEEIDDNEVRSNICWDCETPRNFHNHSDFILHLQSHIVIKSEKELEKQDNLVPGADHDCEETWPPNSDNVKDVTKASNSNKSHELPNGCDTDSM